MFLAFTGILSVCGYEGQSLSTMDEAAKKAHFESFRNKKKKEVKDLLITANYQSCAILAAIAGKEKKVPCILIPAAGDRKGKIWFIPAKKENIISIAEKDLGKFITLLAPERIIVLGDELIVPGKFRPLSAPDRPAVNIVSGNWKFNALILGNLLSIWDMQEMYLEAMKKNITEPFRSLKKAVRKSEKAPEIKKEAKKDKKAVEAKAVKADKKAVEAKKEVKKEKIVETKKEAKAVKADKKAVEVKNEAKADKKAVEAKQEVKKEKAVEAKKEAKAVKADKKAVEVKKEAKADKKAVEVKNENKKSANKK